MLQNDWLLILIRCVITDQLFDHFRCCNGFLNLEGWGIILSDLFHFAIFTLLRNEIFLSRILCWTMNDLVWYNGQARISLIIGIKTRCLN